MTFSFLISSDELAAQFNDPRLRIYDCTTRLIADSATSYRAQNLREQWAQAHILGSGYIDLAEDLSDRNAALRFMLPPMGEMAAALGRLGIGNDNRVVLYSTADMNWAARVWWVLRCAGFDGAAVLDGGFKKWLAEGRPVSTEPCRYPPAQFVPHPRPLLMAVKEDVLRAIGDSGKVIVNGLTRDRHVGAGGMHYGRPGHIAGSVNVPSRELVDAASGTLRPVAELQKIFADAGVQPGQQVLTYCGGGIAASGVAYALTLAGYDNVRLYDGSLQEWANNPALPMEIGSRFIGLKQFTN